MSAITRDFIRTLKRVIEKISGEATDVCHTVTPEIRQSLFIPLLPFLPMMLINPFITVSHYSNWHMGAK